MPDSSKKDTAETDTIRCSIGVPAYNEEQNITHLLDRLLSQNLKRVSISEIIIVCGGCTDSTEKLVADAASKSGLLRLICEDKRSGKASAVNRFISEAVEDKLVVVGADTLPDNDAIERLVCPLADPSIGMVGARPIPLNSKDTFVGYLVHFLWEMHHQTALKMPKCGEMVSFKRLFDSLPSDTIVDEPQIEALVMKAGLKVVYEPEAVVYNLGPTTLKEIFMRRSSIVAGYMRLSKRTDYRVSTQQLRWWLAGYVLKNVISGKEPAMMAAGAVAVELAARASGAWSARFSKEPLHIWEPAETSKNPESVVNAKIFTSA